MNKAKSISPSHHLHRRGFTLIEMLVTVTLVGILLSLAVPSFNRIMVNSKLTAQTNDLVAAINLARSEAIKSNTSMTLCKASSNSATNCVTAAGNWQFWIVRDTAGTVVRRGPINTYGNTLRISSTLTSDQVAFSSDGRARTGGAPVNAHRINVCATGMTTGNIRQIVLGSGSRTSISQADGAC